MFKSSFFCLSLALFLGNSSAIAQEAQGSKQKMRLLNIFDGGQPGVNIYKLFDPSEDVVCYVLTPEIAGRKMQEGAWIYEGNSAGSISCIKLSPVQYKNQKPK